MNQHDVVLDILVQARRGALLAIAGHIGTEPPSVSTIAEQLFIARNSAAELVARMVDGGLLVKHPYVWTAGAQSWR